MLTVERLTRGTKLLLKPAIEQPADGPREWLSVPMEVGTERRPNVREVALTSGDVLVVETPPRMVGDRHLCRVRRALSQSIGEVDWNLLRPHCHIHA